MSELYTTISLTGQVATLLNRDAMLQTPATAGTNLLIVGDSYIDRGVNTIPIFNDWWHQPMTRLQIESEVASVDQISSDATDRMWLSTDLIYDHPVGTPLLRLDYFDVSTAFPTLTAPCTIRIGMEEVEVSSIGYATDRYRCYISSRGENAYPHTEWAPVTDASFTLDNPATDSEIARWGVIEDADYHHGALDQNTLDLYALEKLMAATRPEYGRVEMTGMDVWQDATYRYVSAATYSVDAATSAVITSFTLPSTFFNGAIQDTWWDIRLASDVTTVSTTTYTWTQYATESISHREVATINAWANTICEYDGSIFVCSDIGGNIYNVDTSPGSLVYTLTDGGYYTHTAIHNGVLFIGSDGGNLYSYDGTTWSENVTWGSDNGQYVAGLCSFGSDLYIFYYNDDASPATIMKYDGSTLTPVYSSVTEKAHRPCVVNDAMYFITSDDRYADTSVVKSYDGATVVSFGSVDTYRGVMAVASFGGDVYVFSKFLEDVAVLNGTVYEFPFADTDDSTEIFVAKQCGDNLIMVSDVGKLMGYTGATLYTFLDDGDWYNYWASYITETTVYRGEMGDVGVISIGPVSESTSITTYSTTRVINKHDVLRNATDSATVFVQIDNPEMGTSTLNMYFGSPIAIDKEFSIPTTFATVSLSAWSTPASGSYSFGDRGFATVREGDLVTIQELDGATCDYRISGMIYDQRAGTLTMEIGKPYEGAITDLVKPFRTRDILSTQNL